MPRIGPHRVSVPFTSPMLLAIPSPTMRLRFSALTITATFSAIAATTACTGAKEPGHQSNGNSDKTAAHSGLPDNVKSAKPAKSPDSGQAGANAKSPGTTADGPVTLDAITFPAPFSGKPLETNKLDGGLIVEDFVLGTGETATDGSEVKVHYTGYLLDGTTFDSSVTRNRPFDFPLGARRVIKAWDAGVKGMKVGGKRRLICPPDLAYGNRRAGKIPPGSTLVFTVELLEVTPPPPPPKGDEAYEGKVVREEKRENGLHIYDYALGEGPESKAGDTLVVHYTGTLDDGTVFDSSVPRKRPFTFPLGAGRVIKGWDQGMAGMKVGGLRKLVVPAELGYGARARGKIPANAQLTFTVELMAIK